MVVRAGARAVSKSSVTIPRVVTTGPRAVSRRGLVRLALGCPRQFESVAGGPPPREGAEAPTCMAARAGLESCRAYPLRGCKGFDKCTLRKDSLSSIRAKTYGGETLLRLLLPLNDRV